MTSIPFTNFYTLHKVIFQAMRIIEASSVFRTHGEYLWLQSIHSAAHVLKQELEIARVSEPHHFQFYQGNKCPYVQHKVYANDARGPPDGEVYLQNSPNMRSKHGFDEVRIPKQFWRTCSIVITRELKIATNGTTFMGWMQERSSFNRIETS